MDRLEIEHDNFRAVFRQALDRPDAPTALRLAAALCRYWMLRGFHSEGLAILKAALNLEVDRGDPILARARARALCGLGWLLRDSGDFLQARVCFEQSLELYRWLSDPSGLAYALYSVGYIHFMIGDTHRGIHMIEDSLALYRSLGDTSGLSLTLFMLGRIAVGLGNYRQAEACLGECLQVEQHPGILWAGPHAGQPG